MITARLETEAGGFVTYASVPPFNKLPDVLFLGERTFRLAGHCLILRELKFVPRYREAFAVAVIDGATPRDRIAGGAIVVTPSAARHKAELGAWDGVYQLGNRGIGA